MKKSVLYLSCCLLITGCDQLNHLFGKEKEEPEPLPPTKVGVLISGTVNPFFASALKSYKAFPDTHPSITVLSDDAKNDQEKQFAALDKMLDQGTQVIIINMVDAKQADKVIDKLKGRNIPVVFYNRSPAQEVLFSDPRAVFLDGDAVQGGILQGLDVLTSWKSHPDWDKNNDGVIQYAMLKGIEGNPSAEARTKWAIATMSSYPELAQPTEQIALESAKFRGDLAKQITENWIKDGKTNQIEVILANNDTMAIGAQAALSEANQKIPVFGIDAIPDSVKLVKKGELAGTVVNDVNTQAETAMQVAINLANHRPATQGIEYKMEYQTILIPYKLLNAK